MKQSPKKIRVCNSRSCTVFGSERIMQAVSKATLLTPGEKNDQYDVDYCGCIGWCSNSPNVEVDDQRILFDCEADNVMERINSDENNEDEYTLPNIQVKDDFLGDI